MLEEGRGGFSDFPKYRDAMTKIFWDLTATEESADSAIEEARKLREMMMAEPADTE